MDANAHHKSWLGSKATDDAGKAAKAFKSFFVCKPRARPVRSAYGAKPRGDISSISVNLAAPAGVVPPWCTIESASQLIEAPPAAICATNACANDPVRPQCGPDSKDLVAGGWARWSTANEPKLLYFQSPCVPVSTSTSQKKKKPFINKNC